MPHSSRQTTRMLAFDDARCMFPFFSVELLEKADFALIQFQAKAQNRNPKAFGSHHAVTFS